MEGGGGGERKSVNLIKGSVYVPLRGSSNYIISCEHIFMYFVYSMYTYIYSVHCTLGWDDFETKAGVI